MSAGASVSRGLARVAALVLFLTALNAAAAASPSRAGGADASQATPDWKRYAAGDEEFTALFPEPPSQYFLGSVPAAYRYAAYSDGVIYSVTSLLPKYVDYSLQFYVNDETFRWPKDSLTFRRDVTAGGFAGKQYALKTARLTGEILLFKTKKRAYAVRVFGAGETDPAVRKFLDSFTLGDKPPALEVEEGTRTGDEPAAHAQSPEPVYTAQEVSHRAAVVLRPSTRSTPEAIKKKAGGTIVIKAVLRSSGQVTDIKVVKGLSHGLTEAAVEGVRKAYFLPALKDGKRVSQHMEFQFEIPVATPSPYGL